MHCLNFLCNNIIPDYRVAKQNKQMSRWFICKTCIQTHEPIKYPCFHCGSMMYVYKEYPKFCSRLCKSRFNYGTKEPITKECVNCKKPFKSNLGYYQIYCGERCRTINSKTRKNELAREKYKSQRLNITTKNIIS